jgi:glutaredoxin
MTVKMYTTHCPKCNVMERKLKEANIEFEEIDDNAKVLEVATSLGFTMAPLLEVDGRVMDFKDGIEWIRKNAE